MRENKRVQTRNAWKWKKKRKERSALRGGGMASNVLRVFNELCVIRYTNVKRITLHHCVIIKIKKTTEVFPSHDSEGGGDGLTRPIH